MIDSEIKPDRQIWKMKESQTDREKMKNARMCVCVCLCHTYNDDEGVIYVIVNS